MRFKGGYNVLLKGKPSLEVKKLTEKNVLYLPLYSKRLNFNEICVKEGDKVNYGQVIAKDPDNYSIPLLSPCAGSVKIDSENRHIIVEKSSESTGTAINIDSDIPEKIKSKGPSAIKIYSLVRLGGWQAAYDAFIVDVPDPYKKPQAIIISLMNLEPYLTDTGVFLKTDIAGFSRGIEHLASIAGGVPIYLVLPKLKTTYNSAIKDLAKTNSMVTLITVPAKYPFDNFKLIAQKLNLVRRPDKGTVWAFRTQGILAIEKILSTSEPYIKRIISIAGPGAKVKEHIECTFGYPLEDIYNLYKENDLTRVINGGILTGETIKEGQAGVDIECEALTLVPEHNKREFLAFAHPGITKHSYSNTVVSAILPPFKEKYTTGIRGELRPCLSCGFCEQACPSGIIPHLIVKYLKKDRLEEALKFRLDLCVQCGLCSLVCVSKIENKQKLYEALQILKKKLLSKKEVKA